MSDVVDLSGLSCGLTAVTEAFRDSFFNTLLFAQISKFLRHNLIEYIIQLCEQHIKSSLLSDEYPLNGGEMKLVA
jgi:hypothetical protein